MSITLETHTTESLISQWDYVKPKVSVQLQKKQQREKAGCGLEESIRGSRTRREFNVQDTRGTDSKQEQIKTKMRSNFIPERTTIITKTRDDGRE